MAGPIPETTERAAPPELPCPSCREPVHPEARKCRHCGEPLRQPPPNTWQRAAKAIGKAVGIFTTALSLFYTLREGYYFIAERQEQREVVASYVAAASEFEALDNLDYAERSLSEALRLKPNDVDLQRRQFLLQSNARLREIEDGGGIAEGEADRTAIESLILDGFRIVQVPLAGSERAALLVTLGRLLAVDPEWKDETRIASPLEEAHALAPDDAEVAFRYGRWLLAIPERAAEGLEMLRQATRLAPEDALYRAALGRQLLDRKEFPEALKALETASRLAPSQHERQRVLAANGAKAALAELLLAAHREQDITGPEFLRLAPAERQQLLEEPLASNPADRPLNLLAARFYHARGDEERAVRAVRASLFDEDLKRVSRAERPNLDLYAAILERSGQEPETLARLKEVLAEQREAEDYEASLEMGAQGGHRYKIGLKVKAGSSEDGVLVVVAHEAYPFAKAGVQAGDRIVELAHRKTESFRDIWTPLLDFDPGTQLPLKVRRGEEILSLSLVVE
jgi:tetratricopeptide (TPR) repeat protein